MVTYHSVRDHKYIKQVTCLLKGALSISQRLCHNVCSQKTRRCSH